jgi:hypothetical protein
MSRHLAEISKQLAAKQFLLLFDLKVIRLREQVRRNREKFPVHFMFQFITEEVEIMVSHFAIPSKQHLGGYLPLVFTEHGVLQLANVLKSEKATLVSISLIEIFIKMRSMLMDTLSLKLYIEKIKKKLQNQDKNIELVFNYLDELMQKQEKPAPRNRNSYK